MADQLQSNDHMMSANGIKPWHGIGTVLEGLATASEAIEAANLGWNVISRNTAWLDDEGQIGGIIPGEITNVRSDDGTVLGIVGEGYHILQNNEAFGFFDSIAEAGDAIYETAGSLFGGRLVFITAAIPGLMKVGTGDDVLEKYLLLSNAHDGSGAVKAKLVNTRVVCNNTLSMALKENGAQFSIRHTAKMAERISKAHEAMGIANRRFESLNEIYNEMAKFDMSTLDAKLFLEACFREEPKRGGKAKQKLITGVSANNGTDDAEKLANKRSIDQIGQIFVNDGAEKVPGQDGKTLWHAFNAVTYWTNHSRTYKEHAASSNTREDNTVNSILWGKSADLGAKALSVAAEMLKSGPSRVVVGTGVDFPSELVIVGSSTDVDADVINEAEADAEVEIESVIPVAVDADAIKPVKAVKANDGAKTKVKANAGAEAKAKAKAPAKAAAKKNTGAGVKANAKVKTEAEGTAVPVTA